MDNKIPNIYLLLFTLYWAQGLPVGFMTHALPVLLRAEGVSLAKIGGFGLLMLPWALKALWAPWIDQRHRFRFWILWTQFFSIILLIILANLSISNLQQLTQLYVFFIVLFLLNSAGATQDIATDGLAVHLLHKHQQHWGNALQVIGSRLGFIVGGGAMLWAVGILGWYTSFLGLAVLIVLNTIPILFYRQHSVSFNHLKSNTISQRSWRIYFDYFIKQKQQLMWLLVLLSFKIADGLLGPMSKTMMVDLGLSLSQIGLFISILGAVAALIGACVAAGMLRFLRRDQALIWLSSMKLFSLLGMVWLAIELQSQHVVSHFLIYLLHAFEEFCSAMLLVVIFTLIMQYCRMEYAATDFTLQVSVMALMNGFFYFLGGIITQYIGYSKMSSCVVLIGFISLYLIFKWKNGYMK